MGEREIRVPEVGDFENIEVIEVLVAPGERIELEQSLITLESDKASMEVPSPAAGVVESLQVAVGDRVEQGSLILTLAAEGVGLGEKRDAPPAAPPQGGSAQPGAVNAPPHAAASAGGGGEASAGSTAAPPRAAAPASPPEAAPDCDLLVLGGGPGGYTAAFRAADLGLKVILVEQHPVLGGVCLNVGCIPSKALLHAAKVVDEAQAFAAHGIRFGAPQVDLEALNAWKRGVVKQLTDGLAGLAKQRKVEVVTGFGRFVDPHRVHVVGAEAERTVQFRSCIVASGSHSVVPPGLDCSDPRVIDSTGALALAEIPERLLVVGGGIIGLEMASIYRSFGAKVTLVELADRLMPGADPDLVKVLRKRIEPRYEAIYLQTQVTAIKANKKSLTVTFTGEAAPQSERFDRVLIAVGRRPNSADLDLEAAGLVAGEGGFLAVDEQQRTAVPHIYAIGDLVGQPMLAHKAVHEGKIAAEVVAGEKSAWDARVVPSVAYTDPEVAWVGVTEVQAKADGVAYEKALFPWAANGRALSLEAADGLSKLLFDVDTGRVIGGGIVGPGAGDLIAEVALAIEMGADAHDIGLTVHPHPTLSETVAMAAETAAGTLTDLIPKKRRS